MRGEIQDKSNIEEIWRKEVNQVVAKELLEIAIDATPIIGDAVQIGEIYTGKTLVKQEELGPTQRILMGLTAAIPFATTIAKGLFKVKLKTWKGSEIDVYKNPTREDYKAVTKRFHEKYPDANPKYAGPKARSTVDKEGNKYLWMAGDATHEMVESQLKDIHGVVAKQNFPEKTELINNIIESDLPITKKAYAIAETKPSKQFLKDKQKEALELSDKLMKEGDFDAAMESATDHQMWREALEKLEGQPQHDL